VRRLGNKRAIVTGAVGGIVRSRPQESCRGSCKSARGRVERVRQALAVGFARSRPERPSFWARAQPLVGYPPWLPVPSITSITLRGRRLMLWEPPREERSDRGGAAVPRGEPRRGVRQRRHAGRGRHSRQPRGYPRPEGGLRDGPIRHIVAEALDVSLEVGGRAGPCLRLYSNLQ
jgi:hypothetical protein